MKTKLFQPLQKVAKDMQVSTRTIKAICFEHGIEIKKLPHQRMIFLDINALNSAIDAHAKQERELTLVEKTKLLKMKYSKAKKNGEALALSDEDEAILKLSWHKKAHAKSKLGLALNDEEQDAFALSEAEVAKLQEKLGK